MPTYRLVHINGDQTYVMPPDRVVVVGRAVTSDLAVIDPTVSRRHAELSLDGDSVRVKDLESSNGTFINGTRVSEGTLRPNDTVTFGKVTFQFTGTDAAAKIPPTPQPHQVPGGTIVRQIAVSGSAPSELAKLTDLDGSPSGVGQLRVQGIREEERQATKLKLLLDISQSLAGEFELDRLLSRVVDMTFEVMNVDRVSILLREESSGELYPKISKSRLGDTTFQHVPRSIASKVVEERVGLISENAAADTRFKGQSIMLQSVRSAMATPLMASSEEVLGILYVDSLTAIDTFSPEDLQFLIAFGGLAAVGIKNTRYADRIQREALVRSNFERYFAPNVAAEIAQMQAAVKLGGEKRPITVLFSDIRGFTRLSEDMSPDDIAKLLSEYFTEMVDIIFEHGGTLDKFIGDAIMALWGAPIAHEDDPDRAMRAAIAMQQALTALNVRWKAENQPEVAIGIGINYGEVFAGNIGSHRRLEYTVIGDSVNVASRLCGRADRGEILISQRFYEQLKNKPTAEAIEPLSVKNRNQPVPVYKIRA
ncbi:MAG: adenylate/guanylate cyclase domain-containing protein [Gemmatimonadales bacterium]